MKVIVSRNGDELGLDRGQLWCDVIALEDALDAGQWSEAVDLYQGELLEGFHVSTAPQFERWIDEERARLGDRYLCAVEALAVERESAGDFASAVTWWRRRAARDRYNSRVSLRLMRAMAAAGDPASAVQHARVHEALLRDDLNVAPDPQVAEFVRQLREGVLPRASPVSGGLRTPAPVVENSIATARNGSRESSGVSPISYRHPVLPNRADVIIGREAELQELERLLQRWRLVTVLGAGGVGKTHLALSTTLRRQKEQPGSCAVVSLVGVDEMSLASTIAEALGFTFAGWRDTTGQLIDYLRDKRLLLVLDNFEHLTGAGPFLTSVLAETAEVRFLVTSRERLGLRDETVFELEGLRYADQGDGTDLSDAAQLFLHVARRVSRGFRPTSHDVMSINRVCDLLNGMPLGIEMAAALLRVLDCEGIVRELEKSFDALEADVRDVPERHRTLRAVFHYSWDRLDEPRREGLCRLALFRGPFDRSGAYEVGGLSLHLLADLTDASMIRRARGGRFVMHPVFRQYAQEHLYERTETARAATQCYVRFFARLIRTRGQELCGPSHASALSGLTDEIADVRAAWSAAITLGEEMALRDFVDGLFQVYDLRGWYREGQLLIDDAVARGSLSRFMLAKVQAYRARFSFQLSQFDDAIHLAERSYAEFLALGSTREAAKALLHQARVIFRIGRFDDAENGIRRALDTLAAEGALHERAVGLNDLGYVLSAQGKTTEAVEVLRAALTLFEQTGDAWGEAKVLNNLGGVLDGPDAHAECMTLFERALRINQRLGERRGVCISLHNVARCSHLMGNGPQARDFAEASLEIARDLGAPLDVSTILGTLAEIEAQAGRVEHAFRYYQEALSLANTVGAASLALQHVLDIGRLLVQVGDPVAAIEPPSIAASHPAMDRRYRDMARQFLDDALARAPQAERLADTEASRDLHAFGQRFDAEVARRLWPGSPAMRPGHGPELSWMERRV